MFKLGILLLLGSMVVQIDGQGPIGPGKPPSCENSVNGPICQNMKDFAIRHFGKDGAHCNIPGQTSLTSQVQSLCEKDCCQCQGKLRCKHFYDYSQTAARSEYRHYEHDSNVMSFESPLEKLLRETLENKKSFEMFQLEASTKSLWKPNHQV